MASDRFANAVALDKVDVSDLPMPDRRAQKIAKNSAYGRFSSKALTDTTVTAVDGVLNVVTMDAMLDILSGMAEGLGTIAGGVAEGLGDALSGL